MKPSVLFALIISLGLNAQAWAASVADSIKIENPYVRMVPPGAPATAAFMVIDNTGSKDHALVSAKAYINKVTELHTHIHDNGVMRMRQVPKIDLPAGQKTALQPGGLHIMLINLTEPVKEGQHIKIDLTFDDGSTKTIDAIGRPLMKPMMGGKGHMKQGMMSGKMLSNGQNRHAMRLVMHANPALPNLTGIAVKNAAELGLSAEQVTQIKAWPKAHSQEMSRLFNEIQTLEKELIQDALAGESKAELMKKFEKTLALRRQVAETKIDCRDNMKKILTKEQFDKLASIYPMM
ncbi:copper chaperone PCu(A)C [Thiomicrospira sp. XS5]|uniref:copper chaperone PCu(A)C n=1 Tax=Thiomicrospira sp. XS5 TaxID=1775636 RepID=UPI0009EB6C62|nr:copper chaperone PCu(A)C [Thiomicrospira sp. XS5]